MRKIYHLFFPLEDRIKFPRAGWWQGEDPYYTLHIKLIRTAMLHCFWLSRLKTILGHMLIDSSIHSFIWKYLFECQLYERLHAMPCYGMPHAESPVVIMEVSIFSLPPSFMVPKNSERCCLHQAWYLAPWTFLNRWGVTQWKGRRESTVLFVFRWVRDGSTERMRIHSLLS